MTNEMRKDMCLQYNIKIENEYEGIKNDYLQEIIIKTSTIFPSQLSK